MSTPQKEKICRLLLSQLNALLGGEDDITACLANAAALLHAGMGYFWTGFYLVQGKELVLGPFQGPVACSRIAFGRGVCGKAWEARKVLRVDDVRKFEGHISCNEASRSEIVLPIFDKKKKVVGVLDVDSDRTAAFDASDEGFLREVVTMIERKFWH